MRAVATDGLDSEEWERAMKLHNTARLAGAHAHETLEPATIESLGCDLVDAPSTEDLVLGLLALRHDFLNLAELRHCLAIRKRRIWTESRRIDLACVLEEECYLTRQDLGYLRMIRAAQVERGPEVTLETLAAEFRQQVASIGPGARLGRFTVEQEIGRGGMGVVFRGRDRMTGEVVALKLLLGRDRDGVAEIEGFRREAAILMQLDHPAIVKIREVSRERGLDYIAMDYVPGKTLQKLVAEEGPIHWARALEIVRAVASAVKFIHSKGIIHRDLKPSNVMVRPDGSVALMDFGLAGWDKVEVSPRGGSIGTPVYQPPEQTDVNGPFGKISPASDVYGIGGTLYFLLTGLQLFTGRNASEVRQKVQFQRPLRLEVFAADAPPEVSKICERCLEKKQADRYPSPNELIKAIDLVPRSASGARGGTFQALVATTAALLGALLTAWS